MKKKMIVPVLCVALLALSIVLTSGKSGGGKGEPEEDIGNEWQLDLKRIVETSWSDENMKSRNPPPETAAAVENPNGGVDFTFTMYNQRLIITLSRPQIQKIMKSSAVEVIIDGESNGSHKFRYHIGDPEVGSDWNATASFDEDLFANIKNKTINVDRSRGFVIRALMIQSRGEDTGVAFTPPETVTIRSITFKCK